MIAYRDGNGIAVVSLVALLFKRFIVLAIRSSGMPVLGHLARHTDKWRVGTMRHGVCLETSEGCIH